MKRKLVVVALTVLLPVTFLALFLTSPLTSPATGAPQVAAIIMTQTVGTNPAVCATTQAITLPIGGGPIVTCYTVSNPGDVAFSRHNLFDQYLGAILSDLPYTLIPGGRAFLTQSTVVTASRLSSATWAAYNPGPVDLVNASSAITVHVPPRQPAITVRKTVGTNPAVCATGDSLALPAEGGAVVYCYEVMNSGNITLTRHDLADTHLGPILTAFPYTLVPGASAFLTQTAHITHTTVSTATWTAYNPGPTDEAVASDATHVVVEEWHYLPVWRK